MIRAEFFFRDGQPAGFQVCGHSGSAEAGSDIVCAAVSSAVYLTANTVTDVIGVKADVREGDGSLLLVITGDSSSCGDILKGLRLHIRSLAEQYPENISITDTEV